MGFLVAWYIIMPVAILALGMPLVAFFAIVGYFSDTKENKEPKL